MKLQIPKHIAIIMDGNGKWAKSRFVPKNMGHKKGADTAEKIIESCQKLGVEYLTLYAFSSENWHRSPEEIQYLMELFQDYLEAQIPKLIDAKIKVKFIGERDSLSNKLKELMIQAEEMSQNHHFTLILAISYGGRDEIKQAAVAFAQNMRNNQDTIIDKEEFEKYLYTYGLPDPDLLIRSGGECRISNFLLWQMSYTEFYFTETLWPDFTEQNLLEAIEEYNKRVRRYGR